MSIDSIEFETLYKTHYNKLRNTAHNIISDKDSAHDVVQEVFLKLWHRKEGLHNIVNQKAYLLKSVINTSLLYLESNKKLVHLDKIKELSLGNPTTSLDQKELENKIEKALERLPPKCKTIFVLSRFEELKYKEIAEYLGISVNTVENQMSIALKRLREELSIYLTPEFMALAVGISSFVLLRLILLD